jgi:hypothetical protein
MNARGIPTTCRRWIKADPEKHGRQRLVCTMPWAHPGGWHQNGPTGWYWGWWSRVPEWDWICNGWVEELVGICGRKLRATEDQARAKGWKIGTRSGARDPLCPQCGRPDAATTKLLKELARSVKS